MAQAFDVIAQSPWHTPPWTFARELELQHEKAEQLELEFALAGPIVKWVGGKTRLLRQLTLLLPPDVARRRHIEPFAGGAALLFHLKPRRAVLCDINAQLMAAYQHVQTSTWELVELLRALERTHSTKQYYDIRARYNACPEQVGRIERAAWFIYLNRTCFNGLHRVSRRGAFNVPAGRYENPRIADAPGLFAARRVLQTVELCCGSFEQVLLDVAQSGDFVYMDSPYDVELGATGFTSYAASPFGPAAQDLQANVFRALDRRGCKLMLSNADTRANRARYAGFDIVEVSAPRSISRDGKQRKPVTELVVRNYV